MSIHGHKVEMNFDGYVSTRLICHAPADAQCKAVWDCDCEAFYDFLITDDGLPTHLPDPHYKHRWCTGRWGTGCDLVDWFDAGEDEALTGTVTFDVTAEWGDGYVFKVAS